MITHKIVYFMPKYSFHMILIMLHNNIIWSYNAFIYSCIYVVLLIKDFIIQAKS